MAKKTKAPDAPPVLDIDTKCAQRRVAKVRDKLSRAMADPDMRKQMVAAIRKMMSEGK